MKYCPHPSLIMFDTETVNRLGLPSENGDGIGTWIEAAMDLSKIYVGSRGDFQEVDEYSDISTITPLSGITFPPLNNTRIDVLVVLAGPIDTMTAPIFGDIANTVQDGLRTLGHPSRVIYCSNLATDGCFAQGQQLIVLAAHNLASYFTSEGALAVLEMNLLPPEAGKSHCASRILVGSNLLDYCCVSDVCFLLPPCFCKLERPSSIRCLP